MHVLHVPPHTGCYSDSISRIPLHDVTSKQAVFTLRGAHLNDGSVANMSGEGRKT